MIVVIGAGPAGLAAAWRAAQAGHEVTVLERTPVVGGMAGSFEVGGLRVDHGSHRLHPATPAPLLAALRGLLADDLQVRPRHGRIRLLDRWVGFPLQTTDLVRRMPPAFVFGAIRDAATSPLRHPRRDTFAEVIRAGLGPTVLDSFYGPYARKLWGVEPDELVGELARRRVTAASPLAIARRLARGSKPTGRTFLYPRTGFGAICEALADAAVDGGVDLRLGVTIRGAESRPDGTWRLHLAANSSTKSDGSVSDTLTLGADQLWSTTPVTALIDIVGSSGTPVPKEVRTSAGELTHRAMVLLYMVLERRTWTSYDAHYFPGPEVMASRVSEPRNYRDNPDDPPDRTVLCAEIPCDVDDPIWKADDEDLAERLAHELAAVGLPRPDEVEVASRRLPRVYPIYRPGYAESLAVVEQWVAGLPNLLTFGRQGLFTPDNTHHALAMGWAAADALRLGGRLDPAAWTASREQFRSFVVED